MKHLRDTLAFREPILMQDLTGLWHAGRRICIQDCSWRCSSIFGSEGKGYHYQIDGQSITTMEELKDMLAYYEGGDEITLTVQSLVNGAYVEHEVSITLGTKPAANS